MAAMFRDLFGPSELNLTDYLFANVTYNRNTIQRNFCHAFDYPYGDTVIYGYSLPILSVVSLFLNSLAILVFMTTNCKSPTNMILVALALSDTLALCAIGPMLFIVYGLGNKEKILRYPFCIYHDYSYYVANMFHILSIWLTTLLGFQRYSVVAFPLRGPRLWTRRNSFLGIFILFILSFVINFVPYHQKTYFGGAFYEKATGEKYENLCVCEYVESARTIGTIYTCLKLFPGTIVPCLMLTVTTVLLISELKRDTIQILLLHSEGYTRERRDLKQIERTSRTIIVIAVCFLFIELPFVTIYIWILIEPDPKYSSLNEDSRFYTAISFNFLVYFGSMINFFVFITMSHNFRKKLKFILLLGWIRLRPSKVRKSPIFHTHESNIIHNVKDTGV